MIYVLMANGFEEVEALTPVDVLRRADIEVMTAGIDGQIATGAHGITVACDMCASDIEESQVDGIILPGGMPGTTNLQEDETVNKLIDYCAENNLMIAAICAAPMILGEKRLLDGRAAVCFPGFEEHLHGAELSYDNVKEDGNIITAKGAGCAMEFSAAIVDYLTGDYGTGDDIIASMQYPYSSDLYDED